MPATVQATDILTVKNLSSELTTITNWYQLGLYLDLQTHELDKIQQEHAHQGNDRQMLVMLTLWLRRTPNPTWDDVVTALEQLRENRVAESVRQKYIRRASNVVSHNLRTSSESSGGGRLLQFIGYQRR